MKQPQPATRASEADGTAKVCRYADLQGLTAYRYAWDLQQSLVAARHAGRLDNDILLLLEHPPVFTLGRRGGTENLCVSPDDLAKRGIDLVHIERGGDITYHGPGQFVGYPILRLRDRDLSVVEYVNRLEAVMIQTAAQFDVQAGRDDRNRGVWVGNSKLGSIGIAVRRGISFHGFALNVNTALEPFDWVHPCGLQGVGVTSLAAQRGTAPDMADVKQNLCRNFASILQCRLKPMSEEEIKVFCHENAEGDP